MKFEPRHIKENVNVASHNHFGDFIRLSLYLLALVIGAYFVLGFAADKIAERMSPRLEAAIAGSFAPGLDSTTFPHTREYLQKVLDSLVASSGDLPKFSYAVSIQDNDIVNAVALPAGNIVVFKGLLSKLKSENEAAMVLAHELGHYAHRDHLHGLGRGLVLMSIMTALGLSGDIPGFVVPSVQTFNLKYSRDQESAADRYAVDLFKRTYGHVGGALDFFNILESQGKEARRVNFFSTHPDTRLRIQALADYIRLKKYPQGTIRRFPESESLPFSDDLKDKECKTE